MNLYWAYFGPNGLDAWGWLVIIDDVEEIKGPTPGCFVSIPKCPCTLAALKALPGSIFRQKDDKNISDKFHPGSSECWRIWTGQSGNQCCYDEKGRLITWGAGAGTPDEYGPGGSVISHYFCDVVPFNTLCRKYRDEAWREYHALGWEPINASGCVENPKRPKDQDPTIHDKCKQKCLAEVMDMYSGPSNEANLHFWLCYNYCLIDFGL